MLPLSLQKVGENWLMRSFIIYYSLKIIWGIKSRTRWAEPVANMRNEKFIQNFGSET
jgi:hypothetical protein